MAINARLLVYDESTDERLRMSLSFLLLRGWRDVRSHETRGSSSLHGGLLHGMDDGKIFGCERHNRLGLASSISTTRRVRALVANMRVWFVAVLLPACLDACMGHLNTPTPILLLASPHDTLQRTGTTHEVSHATRSRLGSYNDAKDASEDNEEILRG